MKQLPIVFRRIVDQRGVQRSRALAIGLTDQTRQETDEDQRALEEAATADGVSLELAAAYVLGRCDGAADSWRTQRVDVVWTGPSAASAPVRSTAAVLIDVIAMAQQELVLMTYSAKPHEAIRNGLESAVARGVSVDVVVETLSGARSALAGSEPAVAFHGIAGVRLWHWPKDHRPTDSAKMHAKMAVADGTALLVSSANLTQSGVQDSLEAGLLIRGGSAPQRALEHVRCLQVQGTLRRLTS